MSGVNLQNVTKKYGETQVIHGVDLGIAPGEFCVFVGPSGCGKSTLLRMIAGLEETTSGEIRIGARDVTRLDPAQRGVAMVFQTYALYPHMTVAENMGFGLKMNGHPKAEIREKVAKAADILRLNDYLTRKPKALSGGQRQRVAIGRAIVRGPEVFLFDEPLSNLDAELRVEMRVEIARLHREIGATMIYVTHDQVEAMTLADKIVVLRGGRVEQTGAPLDLYRDPDNLFVAGFIGSPAMNLIPARAVEGGVQAAALGPDVVPCRPPAHGADLMLGFRPQDAEIIPGDTHTVEITEALGGVSFVHCAHRGAPKLVIETKGTHVESPGAGIALRIAPESMFFFDPASGRRLR
ncbi:MAG: sn-glycerol-3-phosphate ABC transporter ATP-binding protein UgpC [Rhodobacteraceae bacterium]|nr:sn-glycerol-3-phosphate ABC transporter ATP-binding protein UgpC [Paracoccaceae bacterium]